MQAASRRGGKSRSVKANQRNSSQSIGPTYLISSWRRVATLFYDDAMPVAPLLSLARHDRRTAYSIHLMRDFIFAEFHPAGKRDEITQANPRFAGR